MAGDLFDMNLRAMRRDRAARLGPELFLLERSFEDCLDRLSMVRRRFSSVLLLGCPDPSWRQRIEAVAGKVDVVDPGPLFAVAAGGSCIVEDGWAPQPRSYDLCLAIGTLDSVNDLARALMTLRFCLVGDGLLLGAMAGGETLPQLRTALRAADTVNGAASPHVHPRIEPSALAGLLTGAGFEMPVVDVDRVQVSYPTIDRLISDLRRMGTTNILSQRRKTPLLKAAKAAASEAFAASGNGSRTQETFEILHFAAWAGADQQA